MARMTLKQAMQMKDLKGLTKRELMDILAPIRDAANKRLGRLESSGAASYSPAYHAAQESGGRIYGSKYSSTKDIESEIERGRAIISYKTSTVSGAKAYGRKMTGKITDLNKVTYRANLSDVLDYEELSGDQITTYWKIMDKLGELGQTSLTAEMYNTMKALIRAAVNSDEPINELLNRLPAGSRQEIELMIQERGGFVQAGDLAGDGKVLSENDALIENALNIIDSYLTWRTEYGYIRNPNSHIIRKGSKKKKKKENPEGAWKVL